MFAVHMSGNIVQAKCCALFQTSVQQTSTLFFSVHTPSPKGLSVSRRTPVLSNIQNQPCLLGFQNKMFYLALLPLIRGCFASKTADVSRRFSFVWVDLVGLFLKRCRCAAFLSSAAFRSSQQFGFLALFYKTYTYENERKDSCCVQVGVSPHASANGLLHWMEKVFQRGSELCWKTSKQPSKHI